MPDCERRHTNALLRALGSYQRANGRYPAKLSPESMAGFMAATEWPTNAFTGEPVAQASESPGDFRYEVLDGGQNVQLSMGGWDGVVLFYDSARFGPISE